MAKSGLSSRQLAKTLLVTVAIVLVLLLLMTQLTEDGQEPAPVVADEQSAADAAPTTEPVTPPAPEPEQVSEPEPAPETEVEPEEPEPAPAPEATPEPEAPQEAEATPQPEMPEPAAPPPEASETPEPQPEESASEVVQVQEQPPVQQPSSQPDVEREIRSRLSERMAAAQAAMDAMEARREETARETLAARMAEAMTDSLKAEERKREADADAEAIESMTSPLDEELPAELAEDKAEQTTLASLLEREFEVLKEEMLEPAEPPSSFQGTARVGDLIVEHRSASVMPVQEGQRLLSAVGKDEAMFIRSLRWNGQAKAARDLWIGMGATYALLPPRGSYDPIYRIGGRLDAGADLAEVDQDDFFTRFSNRFTYLTTGEDARAVNAIEARLLRTCGNCAGYRLTLVWNWETLALILSDARALAREKGLRLPQDIKLIEWLAIPGSSGRARIEIVKLIARNGTEHAP